MNWLQLSVRVSVEQAAQVVKAMEVLGSLATTQENAGEDSYYDLAYPGEPKWNQQKVTSLFEDRGQGEHLQEALRARLDFSCDIELSHLPDQDWETVWLTQFEPMQIAPNLWVYPSWIEAPQTRNKVIKIDPGMAFGTGSHETTRLCMQALNRLKLIGKSVLDFGCGSGILAITALKLGAKSAIGVDIDPKAEQVAQENALNNGVVEQFTIQSADEIEGRKFDVVVANILAFALIDLAPRLIAHSKPNSVIVLSGILGKQAKQVISAYQSQFAFTQFATGTWVVLVGRKQPSVD